MYINNSFLLLNSIPLYGYATIYLLTIDEHLICSNFRLLKIALLCVYVHVFVWIHTSISLGVNTWKWMAGSYGKCVFKFLKNYFPQWLYHFTFPPAMYEVSIFFTFLLILAIVSVFNFRQFNRCIVASLWLLFAFPL